MARKLKNDPMVWRKEPPFVVADYSGMLGSVTVVVVGRSFMAWRAVYYYPLLSEIRDSTIQDSLVSDSTDEGFSKGFIYGPPRDISVNWAVHAQAALQTLHHLLASPKHEVVATPEAVRLIGELIPFSKKEEAIVADKLNKKAGAVKNAAKGGSAKAAKAAKPVGKGGKLAGGKKGGNPEALAKAREAAAARNAEVHAQKLTVLVKPADVKLRGGRLAKFTAIAKAKPKTVGAALGLEAPGIGDDKETYTIDMGALRGMEKRGHIQIG